LKAVRDILASVAETIDVFAAPAPVCHKFRLWLQLEPFSPYTYEKIEQFSRFHNIFIVYKYRFPAPGTGNNEKDDF
jgi:hypothetical protein